MDKNEFDAFDEDDFLDEDESENGDVAEEGEEGTDTDAEEADEQEDGAEEASESGTDFAAMAESDLSEITKAFPSLGLKSLGDIQNIKRFAELRDKGVSAAEAFAATNAQMLMEGAERVGASKATGKAHLQSVAKKAGARAASQMTSAEREAAREFFGDNVSDKELEQLFKKATKK
jgi:hypothetical protein